MKFSIGIPTASEGFYYPAPFATAKDYVELAQMAERFGFCALWSEDRYTVPPSARKGKEPQPNLNDPFISLAYLAAFTKSIRLGTGTIILPMRDPVVLAKQASTLDVFSGGRVMLGVGVGAMRAEFLAVRPRDATKHRGQMLEESLDVLNLLFTQEEASFKGRYYEFQGVSFYPKPVQKPLPVYLSGNHPEVARRVAKWGSGWMLSVSTSQDTVTARVDNMLPMLEAQGRSLSEIDLVAVTVLSLAKTRPEAVDRFRKARIVVRAQGQDIEDFARRNLIGTPTEVAERIWQLQQEGVTHCMISKAAADTYAQLKEQVQWFAEDVMGQFK